MLPYQSVRNSKEKWALCIANSFYDLQLMDLTINWQNYNSCLVDESCCLEKLLDFLLFLFPCNFSRDWLHSASLKLYWMFPLRICLHLGFIHIASLSVFQWSRDIKRKTNKQKHIVNSPRKIFLKNMNNMEISVTLKIWVIWEICTQPY